MNQDLNVDSTQLKVSTKNLSHQFPPLAQPPLQESYCSICLASLEEAYFKHMQWP